MNTEQTTSQSEFLLQGVAKFWRDVFVKNEIEHVSKKHIDNALYNFDGVSQSRQDIQDFCKRIYATYSNPQITIHPESMATNDQVALFWTATAERESGSETVTGVNLLKFNSNNQCVWNYQVVDNPSFFEKLKNLDGDS